MPHFYARKIDKIAYPISKDGFLFSLIANNIKYDDDNLVLVRYGDFYFFFMQQNRGDKVLVKYNKHLKCSSIDIVKKALKIYMELCNADVLFHNLNQKKDKENLSPYLLSPTKENISNLYKKSNYLSIEIGFGSGRHLLDLAQKNKDIIFLGIEIYNRAIEQVLNQIKLLDLKNLYIINADCRILFNILDSNVADSIYLHFPVPWDKNPSKRVFSKEFLKECERILKKGAFLELRSDSAEYFAYALDLARDFHLFDIKKSINSQARIISKYEARWKKQNKDIYEARFILKDSKNYVNNVESNFNFTNLDIKKILDSSDLKLFGDNYFLHIKNIYKFDNGYVLFVLFGAFSAPSKIYLLVNNYGNVEVLGDIIKTEANIKSLQLIKKWSVNN